MKLKTDPMLVSVQLTIKEKETKHHLIFLVPTATTPSSVFGWKGRREEASNFH